jgi:radical SAM superfamily enzyme YgiQ (UPF0313 family)
MGFNEGKRAGILNVLIVSANSLPAAPTGPAYVAGAALRAGHDVEIFECLFAQDAPAELKARIERFRPDVVGISIRLVHGFAIDASMPYNTRAIDFRPGVKQIVAAIRQATGAPIILGGPGFNYYARDWLDYLELDYGIRGEADVSFPLYLRRLEQGGDLTTIPGCVYRKDGVICKAPRDVDVDLEQTAFPAYQLMNLERYQQHGISPGILTKRGCAFKCTYCPYASLEGARYRLKSPARVVAEMGHIRKIFPVKMIMFCENNFNAPRRQAELICREIIDRKLDARWGTGDLRPKRVSPEFCALMRDSGCDYVNLSIESGSAAMLRRMQRGYSVADARQALESLSQSGIPFGASLMLGAPGETPETVAESLALIDEFEIPQGVWVTVGICLWTPRQAVLADARRDGQLIDERMLFEVTNYLSLELPRAYMEELIG